MAILARILWGGLIRGEGAGGGNRCWPLPKAVHRGAKRENFYFAFAFQLAGLALVAPMCFALHCLLVSSQVPEYRLDSKPGQDDDGVIVRMRSELKR